MSLQSRKELLLQIQKRYKQANWNTKRKILNEFIAITGYRRKYAIHLINQSEIEVTTQNNEKRLNRRKYDEAVKQALLTLWYAANQICSKRLVPFIPDLLTALERFGHISLPIDVRNRLIEISPATADRLLETERRENKKGASTTRPGSLLKKQIKVRTFADWNDVVPGFLEGDLVAHCGDRTDGPFLNTLVLTDIASTWTEFFPLLCKSEASVIAALEAAQKVLPFLLLGLDTDNGSEFINYALLDFCKNKKITFTRSRAYKKNDQAHVEEKNGSIVRRLIGYDRYEGLEAYNALLELYAVLRLYVNFFQPSLKLMSKKRDGAKVTKKYDKAKTPYQRLLISEHISAGAKEKIIKQYNNLDPLKLLKDLERLQDNFWKHAWQANTTKVIMEVNKTLSHQKENILSATGAFEVISKRTPNDDSIKKIITVPDEETVVSERKENILIVPNFESSSNLTDPENKPKFVIRRYRRSSKPRKNLEPRTWRTRKDPFENAWPKIKLRLELNPQYTAKILLDELIKEYPNQFKPVQLRTLQRRVADWRKLQIKINQEKNYNKVLTSNDAMSQYVSLIAHSVTKG